MGLDTGPEIYRKHGTQPRVAEVTVWINGEMHQKIANLNDNLVKIIRLFGPGCEKYYGLDR